MKKQWAFDDKEPFVGKLRELLKSGVKSDQVRIITPFHVHEAEHLLHEKPSPLKFFTLTGALLGGLTGFAFTIGTVLHWPLITSGKPLISIPPFIIIAFELTILFGALASFLGFLILGRFPSLQNITTPEEFANQFVIIVEQEGK
jgi:hypothetical protein